MSATALLVVQAGVAPRVNADDLDTVRTRVIADLLESVPSATTVNGYASSMSSNGSWSDINYGSTTSTNWAPQTHLERLVAMSEAYSKSGHSLYHDAGLKADILKAFDYWISRNPQSSNWFDNEISAPQELANSMVLIGGILSSTQKAKGIDVLERAYRSRSTTDTNAGQNRVWRANVTIYRGLIADSTSITADGFAAIGDTFALTTGEGMQRDGSFHQHGNQLYNGGYGSSFLGSVTKMFEYNEGTQFAFSTTEQRVLIDHLIDGTQWLVRGQQIDLTAGGREITRKGYKNNADVLSGRIKNILDHGIDYRTSELTAFRARILSANETGRNDDSLSLIGNKQFWQSDLMTHHRAGFYSSVKTSSTRTIMPEASDDEGLKSLYLGDGVNLILRTGNEYDDIAPVWNWRRLPGTTVEQDSRSLKQTTAFGMTGTATYAGGVTDGKYGMTGFRYNRFNVEADKAWAFFDKEFVALGNDIDSPDSTGSVNTTVNQSLYRGTVSYKTTDSSSIKTLAFGNSTTPANLKWVHHDGTGYVFINPADNATIRAAEQSGTWEAINTRYDDTTVTKDVFTLYINHGSKFSNDEYRYIVVPGIDADEMDAYVASNPISILHNNVSVMAIRQNLLDITQATFYASSTVNLGSGQSFSASDPSAIIMKRPTNSLQFTAASPVAGTPDLEIGLTDVKFSGSGSSWLDGLSKVATITLGLPTGTRAGDSVGMEITTDGDNTPYLRFTTFDTPTTFAYRSTAALALPGNTTIAAGSNKTITFTGAISGSNASLTKTGAHILNLSGTNTYTGGTIVDEGIVNVSGDQRGATGGWKIGINNEATTVVTFNSGSRVTVAAGKEIRIGADSATGTTEQRLNSVGTVINSGSLFLGRHAYLRVIGTWTQTGDIEIFAKGDDSYSPILSVDSGGEFTYTGTSTIKLNPSLTSTGDAMLKVGDSNGDGTFTTNRGFERTVLTGDGDSYVVLRNKGVLILSANIAELTTGDVRVRLGNEGGIIDTKTFTIGLRNAIGDYSDDIGSLTKRGTGTLELFAGGTYTGGTIISAGTLKVSNTSGSATGTGAVSIESGATLAGKGRVSGAVTVKSGATIAPGASSGTLATGAQTWAGGGTYQFEIAGVSNTAVDQSPFKGTSNGADWLDITGALSITATSASKFNLDVEGIGNASGGITGWDKTRNYTWTIASASSGITNFTADRFNLDVSGFSQASQSPGGWSLTRSGNDLLLNYSTNRLDFRSSAGSIGPHNLVGGEILNPTDASAGSLNLVGKTVMEIALDIDGYTNFNQFLERLQLATGSTDVSILAIGANRPDWLTQLGGSNDWEVLVRFTAPSIAPTFDWNFKQDSSVLLDRIAVATTVAVPEPAGIALLAAGIAALLLRCYLRIMRQSAATR